MCNTVLSLTANGFGPKSPKLPIIPPRIKKKIRRPIMDMINTAKKLGQKTFPNVILLSDII
jgi:hypothetical protein